MICALKCDLTAQRTAEGVATTAAAITVIWVPWSGRGTAQLRGTKQALDGAFGKPGAEGHHVI